MDTLVDKAWNFDRLTERIPIDTILKATHWLEERHRKAPGDKTAIAIALHYLILALRHDAAVESEIVQEYCARARRRQAKACGFDAIHLGKTTEEN
ncbi:MAG TPA: hypothetical protein VGW77_19495 [Candidatus Binatia bacterium]|nr:hypothetical protein [Candidatus Binatia bacterium]